MENQTLRDMKEDLLWDSEHGRVETDQLSMIIALRKSSSVSVLHVS